MYPRKASFTILPAKPNLRNVISDTKNSTKNLLKYSSNFRQFFLADAIRNLSNIKKEFLRFIEKENILGLIRRNLSSVPENLKNQSAVIVRTWTHQCECVVAQRLRRGQQMFCLYSKLWEEQALKEFFRKMKQQVGKRGKELMLGAVGVSAYNWESNRIPDNEIKSHINELEYMHLLKLKTMICNVCNNCKLNPRALTINSTCDCSNKKNIYMTYDDWTVFIEKKDMIVWRRLHESGSYEYKVYGSFDDVYADDFVNVQIDINYRKQWDTTAIMLDVVDKDPDPEMNSDVVYWEMLWPKLFANRDYVFNRRYMVDARTKTILLVSKCTQHPQYPAMPDKHRVEDYRSYMVIKPYGDYGSPGLEFGLTYYDNPGVNIPAAVTSWVAYRAMPDFLTKLRVASREYQEYCEKHGCERFFNLRNFIGADNQEVHEEELKSPAPSESISTTTTTTTTTLNLSTPGIEIMTSPSPIVQADVSKHNYWKYLQPTYYFS